MATGTDVVLRHTQGISEWYIPRDGDTVDSSIGIIKSAYDQARVFFKDQLGEERVSEFIKESSSMHDVMAVLVQTQQKYIAKRTKKPTKTWWRTAGSYILNYETVIDTFISANPEIAALVWGPIKFLLKITIDHEEMSGKIAQAFAEIGSVLSEVEFIAKKLYPVMCIRVTLAHICAEILNLCVRATKWYIKIEQSYFSKVLSAVIKTWPLEFRDIKQDIESYVRRLREQAVIASQAEMRDMHLKIIDIHNQKVPNHQFQMAPNVQYGIRNHSRLTSDNSVFSREISSGKFSRIPYDPDQLLEYGTAMRDRRRARGKPQPSPIWASADLLEWISKPTSALLQLEEPRIRSEESRDLALDIIQVLKSAQLPVIWYLGTAPRQFIGSSTGAKISIVDILKSFIQQLLALLSNTPSNWSIKDSDFTAINSEDACLRLFVTILSHIPRIHVIIDAHDVSLSILGTVGAFWKAAEEQSMTSVVKMLVLTYSETNGMLLTENKKYERHSIILESNQSVRSSRGSPRSKGRRVSTGRGGQAPGLDKFKSIVSQLPKAGA